jgi:hypothetical protein
MVSKILGLFHNSPGLSHLLRKKEATVGAVLPIDGVKPTHRKNN